MIAKSIARKSRAWAALLSAVAALVCSPSAVPDSSTYTYDALGRLQSTTYDDSSAATYTLDAAGNRLSVANTGQPPPGQPGAITPSSITATTATAKWGASSGNVTGYDYNLNGGSWTSLANVLTSSTRQITR